MEKEDLENMLLHLLKMPAEIETVEFKEAKDNFDFDKLGKYFSALSNEANLKNLKNAWLVFGIENERHAIVGTQYRQDREKLDSLKKEIADKTTNRITFIDIYELYQSNRRIIMFQIPAAPRGLPIAFDGHFYGRDGESLVALNLEKIERIRSQIILDDWSAEIIPGANICDLDNKAIEVARANFKNKFPDKAKDVDVWDDITFLNKAKVTIKGKITRTAIILLGKEESEHFINPAEIKIRWILKDSQGNDKDYSIETCPMLLAVDKIYAKIRNLKYRYIKDGTLFPDEVLQYEPFSIREALNNCIAHQDYTLHGRINVIESDDQLLFNNLGSFIPGSVEQVIKDNAPEELYRNRFLVTAMFNLKMVDTIGSGIRKMFTYQKKRFFPMPDYDLSNNRVKVTLLGKILDMEYARALAKNSDLTLEEIIMLDKVQKHKQLQDDEAKLLKSKNLIEGRKPNFYIGLQISQKIGQKAKYSRNRAFNKQYYMDLIIKAIDEYHSLNRREINDLLWDKLPDWMNDAQRKNKITNLLSELRIKNIIKNKGSYTRPIWIKK